jgi:hypothetical protein
METSSQDRRTRRIHMPRRWWTRALLVASVFALLVAPAAWANHLFSDVPAASPHHTAISNIAGAGITGGCAPGLYCPANNVRRDEMASFLGRGLGRIASEQVDFVTSVPTSAITTVSDADITVPGVAGGQQLVYLQATFTAFATVAGSCNFGIRLHDGPTTASPEIHVTFDEFAVAGANQRTFTISDVVLADSGLHTYALGVVHVCGVAVNIDNLNFIAATFPFGGNGTAVVIGREPSAPGSSATPTG